MQALIVEAEWDPRPGFELSEEELASRCPRDASKAWRFPRFTLGERPDPEISAPDQVVVAVAAAGVAFSHTKICRTDGDGYVLLPYRLRLPVIPGHEVAGEVVEVGPAVRSLRPGDPVAVETMEPCGICEACRRSLPNLCTNLGFRGFGADGGIAELMVTREAQARSLVALRERFGEERAYEIGSLCEPAAVAYVGLFQRAGGLQPGATVGVFGCGPIGLASIALAVAAGAGRVIAFDPVGERCEMARRLGADSVIELGELEALGKSAATLALELTGGRGLDVAVEAAGDAATVLPVIESSLAFGGKLVQIGVEGGAVAVKPLALQMRAGTIYGSMGHIGGFDPVISLHLAGRIDLSPVVSTRYKLSEASAALKRAESRIDPKIVVLPG